jgi:hypothetical protein
MTFSGAHPRELRGREIGGPPDEDMATLIAEVRRLRSALAASEAQVRTLREALSYFIADDRFQVGVGGNPIVVKRMFDQVISVFVATRPAEQEKP